jgi:hypothetical protein
MWGADRDEASRPVHVQLRTRKMSTTPVPPTPIVTTEEKEIPLQDRPLPISLYDAIVQRQEMDGNAQRWTRCLIVARIAGRQAQVGQHHQELLSKASINKEGDSYPIHGVALIQSQSLISIVESTPTACMRYLKLIADECAAAEDSDAGLEPWSIEDVRVVANSEDCPSACFGPWAFREITVAREQDIDLEQENVTSAAFSVYSRLVQLGKQLTAKDLSQTDLNSALDHLKQYYGEYLPSNERVIALAEQDSIFSIEDFLSFHGDSIDLSLAAEKVWPIQPRTL